MQIVSIASDSRFLMATAIVISELNVRSSLAETGL
jgi:hypothetical protein